MHFGSTDSCLSCYIAVYTDSVVEDLSQIFWLAILSLPLAASQEFYEIFFRNYLRVDRKPKIDSSEDQSQKENVEVHPFTALSMNI